MSSYRVVSRNGKYIAQETGRWWGWSDMFREFHCGPGGHGFYVTKRFNTAQEAKEAVKKVHMEQLYIDSTKNYEETFYIANNGQICPTRDDER